MASIRITQFAGILPEVNSRLKPVSNAQIAHNCLLTDGSLRPQAEWVQQQQYDSSFAPEVRGIAFDRQSDTAVMYRSFDPVTLTGEPFATDTTVGASPDSLIQRYKTGSGFEPHTVAVYDDGVAGTVMYTRSYDSNKPVNRIYAVTRVRRIGNRTEEGALIPIPGQNPTDILYEGDEVRVELNASALDDQANFMRLYRTISGLDTGEAITNELDTEWHLVDEMPLYGGNVMVYIDGAAATALPLDVCFSDRFHPPQLVARYFGLAESGWFVSASLGGDIAVSERYMHHAYPVENYLQLQGEQITDMVVSVDNVFFGTLQQPYVMALAAGDKAMQAGVTRFPEVAPCLPNSMAAAPGGAIYATGQGLVALGRDGMQVITRDVVNAGDTLYTNKLKDGQISTAKVSNTSFGTYFAGKYIGFCEGPPIDDGFYLTTTLYPVEFRDDMKSSAVFKDSNTLNNVLDLLGSSAAFLSGDLRKQLIPYTMPPDEDGAPLPGMHVQSSAAFNGGTLVSILVISVMQPDSLDITSQLLTAVMPTILIETSMVPDSLDITSQLISGTLV